MARHLSFRGSGDPVPQRLKPVSFISFTAGLKACSTPWGHEFHYLLRWRKSGRSENPDGAKHRSGRSISANTRMTKKLRYMSKIAAIFSRSDNRRLSCTQPIANLRTECL
jgi:hypothetical protein